MTRPVRSTGAAGGTDDDSSAEGVTGADSGSEGSANAEVSVEASAKTNAERSAAHGTSTVSVDSSEAPDPTDTSARDTAASAQAPAHTLGHSSQPAAIRAVQDVFARRYRRRVGLFAVLAVLLAGVCAYSITAGQFPIPLSHLPDILSTGPMGAHTLDETVVWRIRIPRVILGLLVGAALGVGGALMQAVFANPLAEPSIIGVTAGAGVGAAAIIITGWDIIGVSTVPAAAFVGGIIATVVVYGLSRSGGQVRMINLILVGIAVNAVAGALISFMVFLAPTTSREQIIFWQMGSLNGAQWGHVSAVAVVVALGVAVACVLVKRLDVLALGDRAAQHVGVDVRQVRLVAICAATLLTAGAVAYAGLIGFVGLIIPHIVRTVAGPSHRVLVPASALGGAALIAAADVVARTALDFADLPIGIFTAIVGGPTFFILLRRMLRKGGGL